MGRQSFCAAKFKQLTSVVLCLSTCIFVMTGLASCGVVKSTRHTAVVNSGVVSICDIVKHKSDYVGKAVEIAARFQTDHFHYSYFEDLSQSGLCNHADVIQLGYIYKMRDKSVVAFLHRGKALCRSNHQPILCVQTASVTFVGTILNDRDGLYVQLDKVLKFEYDKK